MQSISLLTLQTIPFQAEIKTIIGSIDAQPFNELPNGAEFNFLITQNNTLSEIDIVYEFKHLVYNNSTKEQESATVSLTYPLKNFDGTADISVNTLKANSRATIIFDKTLQVFKLISVSSGDVNSQQVYVYQANFSTNEYTLDQSSNYPLPTVISDGFWGAFVSPANNTGSATIKFKKNDNTYHTTLTLKKYSSGTLVNLVANDILANSKYDVVIIGGEAVLFGTVQNLSNVARTVILGPIVNTIQTSQEIIKFYDNAGVLVWKRITGLEATNIVAGTSRVITFAEAFTTGIDNFIGISVQNVTPANGILFPQILMNSLVQFTLSNTDGDSTLNVYRWVASGV